MKIKDIIEELIDKTPYKKKVIKKRHKDFFKEGS